MILSDIDDLIELVEKGETVAVIQQLNSYSPKKREKIINSPDSSDNYLIHKAVEANDIVFLQWALQNEADISLLNYWGRTALELADKLDFKKASELLRNFKPTTSSESSVREGGIYKGKISRIVDFGVFVDIFPGEVGLVHYSQISGENVTPHFLHDVLAEGQEVTVKVLEIDRAGRIRLSMKEASDTDVLVEKRLLDKANLTIKKANFRISELKNEIRKLEELLAKNDIASEYKDHELLGVHSSKQKDKIKKNYKALSNIYHPDKSGCDKIFKSINSAYKKLSN